MVRKIHSIRKPNTFAAPSLGLCTFSRQPAQQSNSFCVTPRICDIAIFSPWFGLASLRTTILNFLRKNLLFLEFAALRVILWCAHTAAPFRAYPVLHICKGSAAAMPLPLPAVQIRNLRRCGEDIYIWRVYPGWRCRQPSESAISPVILILQRQSTNCRNAICSSGWPSALPNLCLSCSDCSRIRSNSNTRAGTWPRTIVRNRKCWPNLEHCRLLHEKNQLDLQLYAYVRGRALSGLLRKKSGAVSSRWRGRKVFLT